MSRAITYLAPAVIERSGGRCEAVWHPGYRCPNRADEIQHRIARAHARIRDEHLLDRWAIEGDGDVDHLAHLCRPCHQTAHANPVRAEAAHLSGEWGGIGPDEVRLGIIVTGSIETGPDGRPVYTGPHPHMTARWSP